MLGQLPRTVAINGREVQINTDYRFALISFEAISDPDLSDGEKLFCMVDALIGVDNLREGEMKEAIEKCEWFLNGGKENEPHHESAKLMDWIQDEQMIFSAVNDVAGFEIRERSYLHWWTFLGYFNEIREGLFSNVLMIRQKRSRGKELDKSEREFYLKNKDIIDLKNRYSKEELEYIEKLNKMLGD